MSENPGEKREGQGRRRRRRRRPGEGGAGAPGGDGPSGRSNKPPQRDASGPGGKDITEGVLSGDAVRIDAAARKLSRAAGRVEVAGLRAVYGELLKAQSAGDARALALLRPRLALVAGRHAGIAQLREPLDALFAKARGAEQLQHLIDFHRALLGYLSERGGKGR